jgi:hypothetical protein
MGTKGNLLQKKSPLHNQSAKTRSAINESWRWLYVYTLYFFCKDMNVQLSLMKQPRLSLCCYKNNQIINNMELYIHLW